ncbi:Mycothiol acetyltransferase [Botrimarina colliarenosi]|uniref:Mycothiol acetyltransferase n=1 Tax=Botrimarina colliarenosi TaxID=2528001 RepID=A0A5C6AJ83_9BACT|nr:GNAT family N-acetyltransferase [Botrimarina colliarenosi]TWT99527.1 Mycothiol acetyltransferase [Botrimarina colliarenosi]
MPDPSPVIRVAAPHEQRAALELALRPLPAASRGPLLDAVGATAGHPLGPLDALLVAVERERVVAATWAQPSPGAAAALWPPEWVGARPPHASAVELALVKGAAAACDAAGIALTQALFEIADDPRIAALQGARFREIAKLRYLGRTIRAADSPTAPDAVLTFEPLTQRDHSRLKRLLKRTYIDSLDCPGLDDYRDLDDVLESYRATGRYDALGWQFVQQGGDDIGVVIVAEHPDADQAELIYMGLVPEARGQGHGARLIKRAIRLAADYGSDQLMVAVDEGNTPARRAYERAGFASWAKRSVYVRARDVAG